MAQIDGAGQQDTDNEDAEALQAALAQRQVTLQGQPQGGSDVPSHKNSDPVIRRIGNSRVPSASYRKTSCTVATTAPPRTSYSRPTTRHGKPIIPGADIICVKVRADRPTVPMRSATIVRSP